MNRCLFSILFSLFIGVNAMSQSNYMILEKNKKTQSIFNSEDPTSLVSLIKANANWLPGYGCQGVASENLAEFSGQEKHRMDLFKGPLPTVPLVDDFGSALIVQDENGFDSYVYPARDSMYISFDNPDAIMLKFHAQSQSRDFFDAQTLYYLKKDASGIYKAFFSLDLERLNQFEGFTIIKKAPKKEMAGILAEGGLYNQVRDCALYRTPETRDQYYKEGCQNFYYKVLPSINDYFQLIKHSREECSNYEALKLEAEDSWDLYTNNSSAFLQYFPWDLLWGLRFPDARNKMDEVFYTLSTYMDYQYARDENGNFMQDENGNIIIEKDEDGNYVGVEQVDTLYYWGDKKISEMYYGFVMAYSEEMGTCKTVPTTIYFISKDDQQESFASLLITNSSDGKLKDLSDFIHTDIASNTSQFEWMRVFEVLSSHKKIKGVVFQENIDGIVDTSFLTKNP